MQAQITAGPKKASVSTQTCLARDSALGLYSGAAMKPRISAVTHTRMACNATKKILQQEDIAIPTF